MPGTGVVRKMHGLLHGEGPEGQTARVWGQPKSTNPRAPQSRGKLFPMSHFLGPSNLARNNSVSSNSKEEKNSY